MDITKQGFSWTVRTGAYLPGKVFMILLDLACKYFSFNGIFKNPSLSSMHSIPAALAPLAEQLRLILSGVVAPTTTSVNTAVC